MMVRVAGSRRVRRVSWAPDASLCKVRLFLSEEAPYQSGLLGPQDQLQPKGSASFLQHASSGPTSDDSALPPGFESSLNNIKKEHRTDVSQIPVIKWRAPVKIVLNPEWCVVCGEESEEVSKQNKRNFGVLEAIYPRQSTVPPNPSISTEAQNSSYNDESTPSVPLIATEEDDSSDPFQPSSLPPLEIPSQAPPPNTNPSSSTNTAGPVYDGPGSSSRTGPVYGGPGAQADVEMVHGGPGAQVARILAGLGARQQQQPDVTAAVSATVTALLRSTERGSLIDQNLLIEILKDPSLVEKLVSEHQNANSSNPNLRNLSGSAPPVRPNLKPPVSQQVNGPPSFSYVGNSKPNANPNPNPNSRAFQGPVMPVSAPVPPPPSGPPPQQYNIPSFNPNPNSRPPPPPLRPPSFSVLRPNMAATPIATQPPPPNIATQMATQPPPPDMAAQMATQTQHNITAQMATQPQHNMATQMTTQPLPPQMNQGRGRNYYMNLIQQHGGEYAVNNNNGNIQKSGKNQKPCLYFNTAKGCRHGRTCMFLHENNNNNNNNINLANLSGELVDERSKKRMKVDSSEWYL